MNVLFVGRRKESSEHKFLCLKKIYKNVDYIDANKSFKFFYLTKKIFWHISSKIFEKQLNKYFVKNIKKKYDLIFVDDGEFIGEKLIIKLKKISKKIIFYCNDNPFVKRDKQRWKLSLKALKYYDLIVFHNKSRIKPSKKFGVKNYLLVLPSYQKKVHSPKTKFNKLRKYNNDVIFIGTWEPERGIFFKKLIELGINVKIYGTRWNKDPNFKFLKQNIFLGYVNDPMYTDLIFSSKIAICLPSVGNKDDITKRSIEIPAIGTLLCAKRTEAHKTVFKENQEAIFFNDAEECYLKCSKILLDIKKIKNVAYNGHVKVTKYLKTDFESVIKKIVRRCFD